MANCSAAEYLLSHVSLHVSFGIKCCEEVSASVSTEMQTPNAESWASGKPWW